MANKGINLIVGLGNPGSEHDGDRHNAGFWFVDQLARSAGGTFRSDRKHHGDICRIVLEGRDVLLLKPGTYMNRSGLAVYSIAAYFKIPTEAILVAHDDLDLMPGTVRLKRAGGHGGHNGLRDVVAHIGRDFMRLRFGIGHPGNADDVTDYVLRRASADDEKKMRAAIGDAVDIAPQLVAGGYDKVMRKLHSRGVTPKPSRKKAEAEKTSESRDDDSAESS